MNRGAALIGALLATLDTPATWPLALAAFLVRGGLVLVLVPIVVLPTPVGFGNVVAPALGSIAFGSVSTGLVVVSIAAALAVVGWIALGGWLAAALEAEAAGMIGAREDGRSRHGRTAGVGIRILVARLVAIGEQLFLGSLDLSRGCYRLGRRRHVGGGRSGAGRSGATVDGLGLLIAHVGFSRID